jgi:hypothetical protein
MSKTRKSAIQKLQEIMQFYTVDFVTGYDALKLYEQHLSTIKVTYQGNGLEAAIIETETKDARRTIERGLGLVVVKVKPQYIDVVDIPCLVQFCKSLNLHVLNFYDVYMADFKPQTPQ